MDHHFMPQPFPAYPPLDLRVLQQDSAVCSLTERSILVTGGTGFIGSHLVYALRSLGAHPSLFVLDEERPFVLEGTPVHRGNLAKFQDCLRIVGRANPQVIFHLAAQPLVDTALDSVIDTMESNVRGAYNLLEACRLTGKHIRAIVWVSTDKVYGSQPGAYNETSPLIGNDHPYDASKLCGDLLAQTYAKAFGLPIVIVRSGNIYGAGDLHWERLIPGTIRSALRGEAPLVRSNGLLKRDYIHVDDIIRAYLLTFSAFQHGRLKAGTAVNFGARQSHTVLDVVRKTLEMTDRHDLAPIIQDQARHEIPHQHVDYSLARAMLDWEPLIDLDIGLRRTLDWYKQFLPSEEMIEREAV